MYLLSIKGKETEGAYALSDDQGDMTLCLFEEHDDAERYAGLLQADDYPEMAVIEIDDDVTIRTCEMYGYKYAIITPDDFVIPPKSSNDSIRKNKMA